MAHTPNKDSLDQLLLANVVKGEFIYKHACFFTNLKLYESD